MSLRRWVILSVVAVVVFGTAYGSLFVVREHESAIILQFGRIVRTTTEPGLHFKIPFAQEVTLFDMRLREWDGEPSDLLTADKENIGVNTWARWRITETRRFYEALQTASGGAGVLDAQIDGSVKNVISGQALLEVLRNTQRRLRYTSSELEEAEASRGHAVERGRDEITRLILQIANQQLDEKYGFVVEGVAIKHINYVAAVIPTIYERMRSERIRIANRYQSEGNEQAATILGETAKELERIQSEGYQESTRIRGEADAKAIKIYADAYGKDPEFFTFSRTLELYSKTLGSETRVVLGTSRSDLFRYLNSYQEGGGGSNDDE